MQPAEPSTTTSTMQTPSRGRSIIAGTPLITNTKVHMYTVCTMYVYMMYVRVRVLIAVLEHSERECNLLSVQLSS